MATKYLDNTGLAYFWGKIKSWVTGRGYITSSGSITGNAATATRLGTSTVGSSVQPIYLESGTATAVESALKTCYGGVESEAVSNTYFKIGSGSIAGTYNHLKVRILVQHLTSDNSCVWDVWLSSGKTAGIYSKGSSILFNSTGYYGANLIVAYKSNSGGSLDFELYVKETARYSNHRFTVIQECWRNSQKVGNILTLYNQLTTTGTSNITSGYMALTTITGTVSMNINGSSTSCSGNAATASAVAWSGVTSKPTTISGYGITDAKIVNGTITLGSNSITPITSIDDSNYVHKTGNESISGSKRFQDNNGLILVNTAVSRGTTPSSTQYRDVLFEGAAAKNLGEITIAARGAGDSVFGDSAIDLKLWVDPYTETTTGDVGSLVGCGWDKNGIPFAMCTGTSEDRDYGGDILTRDWIPKDTRIVHTTGDEAISGLKYFKERLFRKNNNGMNYGLSLVDEASTKGTAPSSKRFFGIDCYCSGYDSYTKRIGMFECTYNTNRTSLAGIYAYKCDSATNSAADGITISYPVSGDPYTHAPTPEASSNTTNIATTAWVRTFCDTTQKYMKSVSVTGSGNAVTAASLSGGTLTLTKGASYVTLDSDQTITGSKTFSTSGSLLMQLKSTAVQRNTDVSSNATCGFSFAEKNNVNISLVEGFVYSNKNTGISILTRKWASTDSTYRGVQLVWQNNDDIFLRPADANLDNIYLGGSSYRWKAVYSANGSIQTSDERMKSEIGFIPDAVLDAWAGVDFCQFKFNSAIGREGREAARFHTGVVAQKVQKAFSDAGLDASRYGLFCYDRWDAEPEQLKDDGTVLQSALEAGDMYSMRYEEALCMEAAYQRRRADRLEARIAALEKRLAAVEVLNA